MADERAPSLSVVIPVKDQPRQLAALLASLERATGEVDHEVVVVDDGSTPPVREAVALGPRVRLVRHEQARGAAAARNSGAAAARADVLWFLDADTEVPPDTLARVAGRFQAEPELGALLGGTALEPSNPEDGPAAIYQALLHYATVTLRAPEQCSLFTPRCGAVRRAWFEAAGGFGAHIPGASVEDYEFGHRLAALTPIRFDRQLLVRHHYPPLGKTTRNYLSRVRMWVVLFGSRRRFDNLGGATGPTGLAALAVTLWPPLLLLPWPWSAAAVGACLVVFLAGFREVLLQGLRLQPLWRYPLTLALTVWLSWAVTLGAGLGALDWLRGRRLHRPEPPPPGA